MSERRDALRFAGALERVLAAETISPAEQDSGLIAVAERLARLPSLLPDVGADFERRVMQQPGWPPVAARPVRVRWGVLGAALAVVLILLGVGLTVPAGQRALAAFAARFGLGTLSVVVTPQPGVGGDSYVIATRETLGSPEEARALVGHAVFVPSHLPLGYHLQSVVAVSYENMPMWIPQPMYLELDYRSDAAPELYHLTVREFGLALSEGEYMRRIRRVDFTSEDVTQAVDVLIDDAPGVLLTMGGDRDVPDLLRLIWQKDEVMLELLSQTLSADELLDIAAGMNGDK